MRERLQEKKKNRVDSGVGLLEPDYLMVSKRDQKDNKENLMEIEVVTGRPSDQRDDLQVLDHNQLYDNQRDQGQGTGLKGGTWKRTERKQKGPSLPGILNFQETILLIGHKRMVQHQREDVCSNVADKLRKKAKGMVVQELDTNYEVEVAYLEWPQVNK